MCRKMSQGYHDWQTEAGGRFCSSKKILAIAEQMLRECGPSAAGEASNNASAQDAPGNGQAAAQWQRVVVPIAEKSQPAGPGIGCDKHSSPSTAERRPKSRKRVLLTAIAASADGARSLNCTICDVSETGAQIVIGKNPQFPPDFYLINIRDRVAYDATVVWNNGSEAGVEFKKTLPLSDIADPSLRFLKRLWLSKAAC